MSVAAVWLVFRSPALDYRLVALGAVLPLGEVVLGGPRLLHTLLFAVALLTVVMLGTRHRRLLRRRLLSLPIGLMMHLVLDGVWTNAEVFWWPLFGVGFPDVPLPELDRPIVVWVLMEAAGAAALWWCWRTFDLGSPENRERLLRTGHLPREMT
ncbi:MAG: hypothetical protein JJU45_10570 [Acidimicrobiia bacterium]|nr:hypothetical protein [Acidimicrobiia bacterium]